MSDLERVWQRLYEKREPRLPLRLADFADLNAPANELGGYIQALLDQGYVIGHVHVSSRDDSGVDDIAASLTEAGVAEYERQQRS